MTVIAAFPRAATRSAAGAVAARGITGFGSRAIAISLGGLGISTALWLWSLADVDVHDMDDRGLVSVLPWTAWAAAAGFVACFALTAARFRAPGWVLGAHVATLCVVLHATAPLSEGVLRTSWAWKHVGVVDYIDRLGHVDQTIDPLGVYHNWPGFFAFGAMLTRAAGLDDAATLATWTPPVVNLLAVAGIVAVLRALSDDRRTVAVGAWIFVLANWVGQGYFAPQAVSYIWYLVVVAIVLRWFPGRGRPVGDAPAGRVGLMAAVLLMLAAVVTTHQLTPIVAVLVLGALALLGDTSARTLWLITAALMSAWVLYVAAPFTGENLGEELGSVGNVTGNLDSALIGYGDVSSGQATVSMVSRGLTAAIVALAIAGGWRLWRNGRFDRRAAILGIVPFAVVVASAYGQEVLFRAYLFALPGLVFFAASLLRPFGRWRRRRLAAATIVVSLPLAIGFVYAQFGNERQYAFTQAELAAVEYLNDVAPGDSLLVEGSPNYPAQFDRYERFTYVPITREPWSGRQRVVTDPVNVLADWLADPSHRAGYVIITRAQKAASEALGEMPGGGLAAVERALVESSQFTVLYHNQDATVLALASSPDGQRVPTVPADDPPTTPPLGRVAVIGWLLLFGSGSAIVRHLGVRDRLMRWTLAVALSLAVGVGVAQAMAFSGAWAPIDATVVLVAVTVVGFAVPVRHRSPAVYPVVTEREMARR